jgi:hypothetical protein
MYRIFHSIGKGLFTSSYHDLENQQKYRYKLLNQFQLPYELLSELKSPAQVYRRLKIVIEQGKRDQFHDYSLCQLFCASGNIDHDFVHLLDEDHAWFKRYFANKDPFFLKCHMLYAHLCGHESLINFLYHQLAVNDEPGYIYFAIQSGNLNLVKKMLVGRADFSANIAKNYAIFSKNVSVFHFLATTYQLHLTFQDFSYALAQGSLSIAEYIYHHSPINLELLCADNVSATTDLPTFQYLFETLNWRPRTENLALELNQLHKIAYATGNIAIIDYIMEKFPTPANNIYLKYAAASGNVAIVNHCLQRLDLTIADLASLPQLIQKSMLLEAGHSGNVALLILLLEDAAIDLNQAPTLMEATIRSCNIAAIDYLQRCHEQALPKDALIMAIDEKNLMLATFIYNQHAPQARQLLYHKVYDETCLFSIYHLINLGHRHDKQLFNAAFNQYHNHRERPLSRLFLSFLTSTQGYVLTDKMITIITNLNDLSMLSIEPKIIYQEVKPKRLITCGIA